MPLVWQGNSGILTLSTNVQARDYIDRVEAADGQALEPAVRESYKDFIMGCLRDGIWYSIKSCCILAGARTLDGALVPLVGTAPDKFGTGVNWNYDRKTGLKGDGSTNYLDSNRNNNADPQNNQHLAVWMSALPSDNARRPLIGCGVGDTGASQLNTFNSNIETRSRTDSAYNSSLSITTGFAGLSRSNPSTYLIREGGAQEVASAVSQTPLNETINVFRRKVSNSAVTDARLAFYSIGESLDLARLDNRVSQLMTDLGAAIP